MSRDETVVPLAEIKRRILTVRGQKVIPDSDLAHLYGVPTKRLNEQVRRNLGRFPPDFMFQLIAEEISALRSQIATSKPGRGGRRYLPYGVPRIDAGYQTVATIPESVMAWSLVMRPAFRARASATRIRSCISGISVSV